MAKYNQNYENNYGPIYNTETIIQNKTDREIISNLPDLTRNFKKTEKFYGDLDKAIKTNEEIGVKIAVYGFSGVGKSAGVVGWAKDTKKFDLKCYIFVRNGDIFAQLVEFFTNNIKIFFPILDEKIKFEGIINSILNPKEQLKVINKSWNSGRKLLILDDVMPENDADVKELLKSLEGLGFCVILTSRRPKVDFNHNQYLCLEFEASQELCMEILSSVYADNAEEKIVAQKLCEYVGNNTFAVEQIWNLALTEDDLGKKLTLKQLLEEIKKEKGLKNSLLSKEDKYLFHTEGIYQTLELIWKKLNENQQFLALLCGQMALAPIPQYWFDEINKANGKKDFEKAKIALFRWLILNKNEIESTFKLHELWYLFLQSEFEELTEINKQNLEYSCARSVVESIKINQPDLMTKDEIKTQSLIVPHLEKLRKSNQELGIIFAIEQCLKIYYLAIGDFENAFNCINSIIEKFDISSVEYFKLVIDKMEIYIQKYRYSNEELNPNLLLEAEKFILEVKIEKLDKLYQSLYFGKYAHIAVDLARIYRKDNTLENIYKSEFYYNLTQENAEKSINLKEQILELRDCDFNTIGLTKHYLVQQIGVIYDYLSLLYMYFEEFEKSLHYRKLDIIQFEKAIEIQQKDKNNLENHDYKKTLETSYYNYGLLYDFANDNEKGQKWLQSQTNWYLIASEYAQKSLTLAEIVFEKEDDRYKLSKNLVQKLKITREYNKLKECNIIIVGGEHAQDLADYWNNNIEDIINQNLDKI